MSQYVSYLFHRQERDRSKSVRRKDGDEHQHSLDVVEGQPCLLLVERSVLDARLVGGDSLDGDEPLAVSEEGGIRRCIGQEEPNNKGPEAGGTAELETSVQSQVLMLGVKVGPLVLTI